jgi:hypothetical protein
MLGGFLGRLHSRDLIPPRSLALPPFSSLRGFFFFFFFFFFFLKKKIDFLSYYSNSGRLIS